MSGGTVVWNGVGEMIVWRCFRLDVRGARMPREDAWRVLYGNQL